MTISNQTILRNDYIANGTNTIFAFNFPIFYEPTEAIKFSIQVIITNELGVETIKTESIDYTITYNALNIDNNVINQGNVVFTTAPANLYKVSLLRKLNLTQNTNLTNKGTDKFSGANVEASLDKLTLINLENKEIFNRCVLLPKSTNLSSIELPIKLENANKVITVNSAGNNLEVRDFLDRNLIPVSSFMETVLVKETASEARTTLDAQQLNANLTALAGLTGVSNLTALASLTGASNKLPYFTGAGTMAVLDLMATETNAGIQTLISQATATNAGKSFLPQKITIANNTTDANNDIDFSGGNFVFSDFSGEAYVPAMTKRLDANWTAGNNNGGLDTGTKAANTWYYCYAIYNPTTQASDFIFSASNTSPTLPSGFTKIRKIASIRTNISGNIRNGNYSFFVNSYRFEYKTKVLIFQSTTSITGTVVDAECPPLTIAEIIADQSSTTDCSTLITSLDADDEAPIHPSYANISSSSQYNGATTLFIRTNSLAQIRRRSSSTSGTLSLRAIGWIEYI